MVVVDHAIFGAMMISIKLIVILQLHGLSLMIAMKKHDLKDKEKMI